MSKQSPVDTPFHYRAGELTCENVPLARVVAAVDTPVYVYSRAEIESRARTYVATAADVTGGAALVCYAVKANGNPALLRLLAAAGLGADVTSGGELFLARHAGFPATNIIFSGVGKKGGEIAEALAAGIRAIHVESEMELAAVAAAAARQGVVAPIGVRVNPDVSADTHPYISTGLRDHKFGVPRERAAAILRAAAADPWLRPVGLAAHIGSQITDLAPFAQSVGFLVALADGLKAEGITLDYIDAGGGLGIDYQGPAPDVAAWVRAVGPQVSAAGYRLVVEPGRSIVGRAGALLTRVVYTKDQGEKRFVIADAGMTDLIRPTLYQAYHPIVPLVESASAPETVDIVGPICETSDFLARARSLPPVARGDLLAILHAGAYGYAMSSNYNGHLRPAEVLVEGDSFQVIRRRQTYDDLLSGT
ncbi:Diaminopimelate decarboxylase [Candidatus Promineifilum breve]|uniref:Diaminopimelate decarboxylase n=1 Tax=Candidatus Promineifilum breve TaxID=1806508 RepID=A0A160SZ25_9CHLR|nr:diaminopimelate decarboxylase [Candidatus Promineifilum breve]CUS01949.2 Diaminopimelate decarboxylase [Candidatus Promineifilum breve]